MFGAEVAPSKEEQKAKRISRRFFDPSKIEKLGAYVKGLEKMEEIDGSKY